MSGRRRSDRVENPRGSRRLTMKGRQAARRLSRSLESIHAAEAEHLAADKAFVSLSNKTADRLDLDQAGLDRLWDQPFLIDVVALVDVRRGACWWWRGTLTNHGTAAVRSRNIGGEGSVPRLLYQLVNGEEPDGMLYPGDCGQLCVNPDHRRVRGAS